MITTNCLVFSLISLLCVALALAHRNEDFHEELFIKPLANGHANTFFQFTTRWNITSREDLRHVKLFPRAIADIFDSHDIRELHIRLTQGLWRYETWGYPVVDAPPGAEVWAWFGENLSQEAIDSKWKLMAGALSGVFCASFNFIDNTNSIQPKYSFRPVFSAVGGNFSNNQVRYSTLPRENVCTENLTPWKKLLPCSTGFISLLNSGSVHNTNYHSLNVEARTLCQSKDLEKCVMELKLTANFVFDPKTQGDSDFSIRKMFGQGNHGFCPLAKSTKIYADVTQDRFDLTPSPNRVFRTERGTSVAMIGEYDIQAEGPGKYFNIAWKLKDKANTVPIIPLPKLFAHRYILGHGQERGKIVTEITNTHWGQLKIVLQENIPWYVPCYMHTLRIEANGKEILPNRMHFEPGKEREKPYNLELAINIPAKSTTKVYFDFDYIFLKWLEYPPDASHGHYLGSAVISTLLPIALNYTAIPIDGYLFEDSFNASRSSYFLQIHTESLILSLPTPDFSMPYNVICLACTVVALAFGPIHSVATKRIIFENKEESQSLFSKLKRKLFGGKANKTSEDSSQTVDEQTKKEN